MSFFVEIRRRKVFQVAAVYAVVAWLIIQIIDVVSDPLNLPEWLDTVVIVLLAVGFPVALVLAWAFDLTPQGIRTEPAIQSPGRPGPLTGRGLNFVVQGLVLLAVGFLVVEQYMSEPGSGRPRTSNQVTGTASSVGKPAQLLLALPEGTHLAVETEYPTLALSPDGSQLVFVGERDGTRQLYIRELAGLEARPISGTEGAVGPFFSPDGSWIAFMADNSLKRVAVDGGAPTLLRSTAGSDVLRGATWTVNDTIVINNSANAGLSKFSVQSEMDSLGTPLSPSSAPSSWPDALPDGRYVLFTENTSERAQDAVVAVQSVDTGEVKRLITGSTSPRYSSTGHVLYARAGSLFAAPFDATTTEITGSEISLVDRVITGANGAAQFAVASDGTLAYVAGESSPSEHELVWVARDGSIEPLQDDALRDDGRRFFHPRLSHDGASLALMSPIGPNLDVWVLNLQRGNLTRWTSHVGEDFGPVWAPDDALLAFASEIGEDSGEPGPGLAWTSGPSQRPEHLLQTPGDGNWDFPTSWSPDGRWLLFTATRSRISQDVYLFDTESREVEPYLDSQFAETSARFSPDGRWIAYVSDESGRREVWVRSFQNPEPPQQMSTSGGTEPVWSRDGRELFYREGNNLMAVTIDSDTTLNAGPPRPLVSGRFEETIFGGQNSNYDVSLDGRFIMIRQKNPVTPSIIHVVLNWPEALGTPGP